MPEISVLMSVYNGEEFIQESIDSILEQTFNDFELIIINDASTDKTEEIIEQYDDNRIKLFNFSENRGVGAALNFGLSMVQGKYIAKADADDIYDSDRLLKQKHYLDINEDITLVGSLIKYFPHNKDVKKSDQYKFIKSVQEIQHNKFTKWQEITEKIYWYCCITHSTIMARSEIIKKIGYEDMRLGEDYKLFYDLNKQGYKMANLQEVLSMIRVSKVSLSTNKDLIYRALYNIKKEEINNLFSSGKVYIWGAGSFGKNAFKIFKKENLDIYGFIDSNPNLWGFKLINRKIYSTDILERSKRIKVIIASQPGKFEIVKYLRNLGYQHLKDFVVY